MINKITIMALLAIALGMPSIALSQSSSTNAYDIACISKGHFVIGSLLASAIILANKC